MSPLLPGWASPPAMLRRVACLGGLRLLLSLSTALAAADYELGPDSAPHAGVPRGMVTRFVWTNSVVYPGTQRDYVVYVPAQYDPAKPACLLVVQDGPGMAEGWQVPVVLDNLIARGEVPVMIGVFVSPGVVPPPRGAKALPRFNRSFEYDALGDRYARFLLEELLPSVSRCYNLSVDPNARAIAGASSGAIAAFNVAWEHPEAFRRVLSAIGTYVGLRGANELPTLIRKTEPKPLRVFLQDGSHDLNIYGGDWFLANQEMLSALEFSGYEVRQVWGNGGHSGSHMAALLPEALRWLWQDYPAPIQPGRNSRQPVFEILIPGQDWQLVAQGFRFTEGPAVNARGEVFFTDIPNNRIHRIDLAGQVSLFATNTGGANGLMFGPDGRLYACQDGRRRIVAYDPAGRETVVAEGAGSNDLTLNQQGDLYFTDPGTQRVWFLNRRGERREVDRGIAFPNGVRLTPDQSLLLVDDTRGQFVYSFQVQADGTLRDKQPYFQLHLPPGEGQSGADGMTLDREGRLYVATALGLQVCDQAGRVIAIIAKPQRAWLSNVCFGGPALDELYVTCGDKVFRRKTRAHGALSWQPSFVPPPPRL